LYDTGAWKQTSLRVALFSPMTADARSCCRNILMP
jgi:hypothetical protein